MTRTFEDIGRAGKYLSRPTSVLATVLRHLVEVCPDLPPVMVVGAECRDALHRACGYDFGLRYSTDLDIALAVENLDRYRELTSRLTRVDTASNAIRYWVGTIPVDLMPFGAGVEHRDGEVIPPPRPDTMSVFGFQDVWDSAMTLDVAGIRTVRLPSVAGYTVLKLRAWLDRAPTGRYTDAPDIATAMYWYVNPQRTQSPFSKSITDRLWETDEGQAHLQAADWEEEVALVRHLIDDAVHVLSPERHNNLCAAWQAGHRDDLLAGNLAPPQLQGWPIKGSGRLTELAVAVRRVLALPVGP